MAKPCPFAPWGSVPGIRAELGGKKAFGGDLWALHEHPCAVPLCITVEKQQLNPGHRLLSPSNPFCLVQGHPQKPAADPTVSWGSLCPQEKGRLKGFCWVAIQGQHGFKAAGHPSSKASREDRGSSAHPWLQ